VGVIVDASVAVKWFVLEDGREAAMALLGSDVPLLAPDLIVVETAHALRRKVAGGWLTGAGATAALHELTDGPIELVPTPPLVRPAMHLADRTNCSVHDACFVALASQRGMPLVTADERLARAVRFGGLDIEVRTLR